MGSASKLKRKAEEVAEEVAEVAEAVTPLSKAEKKARKAAKRAAAAEAEAPVEAEVEEAPVEKKKKLKKKKPVVEEVVAAEVAEEAPKKKKKKAALEEPAEEKEEAPKPKAEKKEELAAGGEEVLDVFIGGIPFSADEATLRRDFAECGEIVKMHLPMNEEGRPRGFAFATFTTKAAVEAACKFDGTEYGGRTLKVNQAGQKGKGGEKGKSKGGGKGNNDLTVCVRGLPFTTTEEGLRKDFAECGEMEKCRMLLNDEGQCRGMAFIEYKDKAGLEEACKFNDTDYGGRYISVAPAGDGPSKGKDGKGKGKDKGKDKGKGKGKDKGKGKATSASFAKSSGAMVESTGEKKTFADSDDE